MRSRLWLLAILIVGVPAELAAQTTAIVVANVNLRLDPSTAQPPIRLLHPPEELVLLETGKTAGYYHVRTNQDEEGWVWAPRVELATTQPYIRVGSFNIAEFGEGGHPATRNLSLIARIILDAQLDLVAIEEVGVGDQGQSQVLRLQDALNAARPPATAAFFSHLTPRSGDERCAVVYRAPVVLGEELLWLDQDKEAGNPAAGGQTFFRIPVAVPFTANDFDFYVIVVHLTWGNLERRVREVAKLRDFLREDHPDEEDWIVMGDMNRYGKYRKTTPGKAFDELLTDGWREHYRLPLLEAITDPDDMKVWKASEDAQSTTIAATKNIYDQAIISAGAFREFDCDSPVFGEHVGIVPFDMSPELTAIRDHNTIKYMVSDHRPLWIRLRADMDDDD